MSEQTPLLIPTGHTNPEESNDWLSAATCRFSQATNLLCLIGAWLGEKLRSPPAIVTATLFLTTPTYQLFVNPAEYVELLPGSNFLPLPAAKVIAVISSCGINVALNAYLTFLLLAKAAAPDPIVEELKREGNYDDSQQVGLCRKIFAFIISVASAIPYALMGKEEDPDLSTGVIICSVVCYTALHWHGINYLLDLLSKKNKTNEARTRDFKRLALCYKINDRQYQGTNPDELIKAISAEGNVYYQLPWCFSIWSHLVLRLPAPVAVMGYLFDTYRAMLNYMPKPAAIPTAVLLFLPFYSLVDLVLNKHATRFNELIAAYITRAQIIKATASPEEKRGKQKIFPDVFAPQLAFQPYLFSSFMLIATFMAYISSVPSLHLNKEMTDEFKWEALYEYTAPFAIYITLIFNIYGFAEMLSGLWKKMAKTFGSEGIIKRIRTNEEIEDVITRLELMRPAGPAPSEGLNVLAV